MTSTKRRADEPPLSSALICGSFSYHEDLARLFDRQTQQGLNA
ncbi:hypothetical protein [Rhizobium etli]|nr:hypothetical protein [Rhizobium etli]